MTQTRGSRTATSLLNQHNTPDKDIDSSNQTMSPTPSPKHQSQLTPIHDDSDLQHINQALKSSRLFLGNPNLLEHVEWADLGRQKILVINKSDGEGELEPAVLEWVGDISAHNFWLYACGGWNGERGPQDKWSKVSPFEKTKARGYLRQSSHAIFAKDWNACIQNVNKLIPAAKKVKGDTSLHIIQGEEIRIRHAIFEPKQVSKNSSVLPSDDETIADDNKSISTQDSSDLGSEFSLNNLPCRFQKASDALEKLKEDGLYDFSPLPATTMNGKPIKPTEYEQRLAGATVVARVTLSCDFFPTTGYLYYADIVSLSVVRPPRSVASSPASKSPSKKRRFEVPDYIRDAKRMRT